MLVVKYYCIKQYDITDCGAACLATICKQNGYKIVVDEKNVLTYLLEKIDLLD